MTALFVLASIGFLILLDWGIRALRLRAGVQAPSLALQAVSRSAMRLAKDVFVAPGHTWARLRESGGVQVGLDPFALKAMGAPDRVELPETGRKVKKGEPLITAVRDGHRLVFPSPLSGTVSGGNPSATRPRSGTWLVTLTPSRLGAELKSLLIGEEAAVWLSREFSRFREFLVDGLRAQASPVTLPDGGLPTEGVLTCMPDETWEAFESEFLSDDY